MNSDPITSPADHAPQNRLAEESPPIPSPAVSNPKPPARHPLQSFGLANFKAFGAVEQTVALRPITLVFGPNSGGKSSLIHYLLWMKDVVEGKGLDIYHPAAGGSSVDLGGFKQIRHGNDPETSVSVKLQLKLKDGRQHERTLQSVSTFASCPPPGRYVRRLRSLVADRFTDILTRNSLESLAAKSIAMENAVVARSLEALLTEDHGKFTLERLMTDCLEGNEEHTVPWDDLRQAHCPKLHSLYRVLMRDVKGDTVVREGSERFTADQLIAELQTLAVAVLETLKLEPPPANEMKPSLARFELSEDGVPVFWAERDSENVLTVRSMDASWLTGFSRGMVLESGPVEMEEGLNLAGENLSFNDRNSWLPQEPLFVQQAVGSRLSEFQEKLKEQLIGSPEIPGLLRKCQASAMKQCASVSFLGPLRAYPTRTVTVADLPQAADPEGLFAWRLLYEREDVREAVNHWLNQPCLPSKYEIIVDHRVGLEAAGAKFEKELHLIVLKMKDDIAALGELNLTGRNEKEDQLNEACEKLLGWEDRGSIRRAFEAVKAQSASQSSAILYLKDQRTGKLVTSRDIGVGMSQVIPVLVHAKAAHGELIAIEQPEIHIHPALQAELGDVFIESAMKQGNTFLIETHSEHLILRLLRRIRETTRGKLPEGKSPLRPEDVCVLYVEPTETGSIVREMPLNERGELVKGWPGGFFEERLDELF